MKFKGKSQKKFMFIASITLKDFCEQWDHRNTLRRLLQQVYDKKYLYAMRWYLLKENILI